MKRLRIRIIIGILAAILVVGLIIYHIPQKRQSTMWVCSTSGEPAKLEMDLKYYRRLFRWPTVKGTFSFNGVEYLDAESKFGSESNRNDWGIPTGPNDWGIPTGPDVLPHNMTFHKENETDKIKAATNRLWFTNVSGEDNFEKICFWYFDESVGTKGVQYFGPAQTPEEAKQIAAYFGYKTN